MYWSHITRNILRNFKKLPIETRKEIIVGELNAQIKRYKDSTEQHEYQREITNNNNQFSYDKICINRNRMIIRDLKSILNLMSKL